MNSKRHRLLFIAALIGLVVIEWWSGWRGILSIALGVAVVARGGLLLLGWAQPRAVLGYSAAGALLGGAGLILLGLDREMAVPWQVLKVAGLGLMIAGGLMELRVAPLPRSDVTTLDL